MVRCLQVNLLSNTTNLALARKLLLSKICKFLNDMKIGNQTIFKYYDFLLVDRGTTNMITIKSSFLEAKFLKDACYAKSFSNKYAG